jgi:hypothetical protein
MIKMNRNTYRADPRAERYLHSPIRLIQYCSRPLQRRAPRFRVHPSSSIILSLPLSFVYLVGNAELMKQRNQLGRGLPVSKSELPKEVGRGLSKGQEEA